jgi:hypothetical protein
VKDERDRAPESTMHSQTGWAKGLATHSQANGVIGGRLCTKIDERRTTRRTCARREAIPRTKEGGKLKERREQWDEDGTSPRMK